MNTGLRAEGLVVHDGGLVALDQVDLVVAVGEVVGLVGANGAGKTTLLDCLSGHLRPQTGQVWLDGRDITRWGPARRARDGVVRTFQDARLFPTMPVRDLLRLATGRTGGDRAAGGRTGGCRDADELAGRMQLKGLLDRRVGELSTGERKRLDLACAAGRRPRVLLLDEPSAGLAGADVAGLAAVLRELLAATGATVVMVEHDLPLVWGLVSRVVVLEAGRVVADDSPPALRRHPALAFARL